LLGPSKIRFDFWLIFIKFLSCLENSVTLSHISELHTLLRKSSHTHTHCMNWVIYLKFLFAYFWDVIWLLYQLILHACSEDDFRENNFSTNFPSISVFSVWSDWTVSPLASGWVWLKRLDGQVTRLDARNLVACLCGIVCPNGLVMRPGGYPM
jgi:hypothetical protein